MTEGPDEYVPALKYPLITSLYDLVLHLTIPELKFKTELVEQAKIEAGHRVLDLGCGTATLTLLIKKNQPGAEVFGIDGDLKILRIARVKAAESGLDIMLSQALAFGLPYPDNSFERVLSSLLFHHLGRIKKRRTLAEVFRILQPRGQLYVADWGKPQNALMRLAFLPVQMLDGFKNTADNVNGRLPELFRNSGFNEVRQLAQYMTVFGSLSLYMAQKPA